MLAKKRLNKVTTSRYFKKLKSNGSEPLEEDFYDQDCIDLAKALLGQILVRVDECQTLRCRIVEVESYLAKDDRASHSYNLKQTPRNKSMFMKPGTLYVYMTYGMYCCMNISSAGPGNAVLIRAAEPLEGVKRMKELRNRNKKLKKAVEDKNISNGPSKLCQALNIDKSCDQLDLTESEAMYIEKGEKIPENSIVNCKRIGLNERYEEWADKPLRYYVINSPYVSVRNKKAEAELVERTNANESTS